MSFFSDLTELKPSAVDALSANESLILSRAALILLNIRLGRLASWSLCGRLQSKSANAQNGAIGQNTNNSAVGKNIDYIFLTDG